MIINKKTQLEMYRYLLLNKKSAIECKEGEIDDFIIYNIKKLAFILNQHTELYRCKIKFRRDDAGRLVKSKNYICRSNILIYRVLKDIPQCNTYATKDLALDGQSVDNIDDIDDIDDNSNDKRKDLIFLCKMFLKNKELEIVNKNKGVAKVELLREETLAEEVLGKYSKECINATVEYQKTVKKQTDHALGLKADIVIKNNDIIIVIDVKVYSTVGKNYYGKFKYAYNKNRYQINSYMGAILDHTNGVNGQKIYGLALHIVNDDMLAKNTALQHADLSIEAKRPIKLCMISSDNGLDKILEEYQREIIKVLESK